MKQIFEQQRHLMAKPKVLFINRVYPPNRGATGRVLQELAQGFVQAGWDVDVLATGKRSKMTMDGRVKVHLVSAPSKPRSAMQYAMNWFNLYRVAKRQDKPDLVISLTDPPMLALAGDRIAKHFGVPHMHWCHDYYPDLLPVLGVNIPSWMMSLLKRLSFNVLSRAERVVVIGRCMARFMALEGLSPRNITVIPNWADQDITDNAAQHSSKQASRHYSDIAKPFDQQLKTGPKFRVLYAGNLGKAHPVETILEAATLLNTQSPEIEFVFVGDGPKFQYIAEERQRRGLDNIKLLPYQPKEALRDLMDSGDLHLISMDERASGLLVPCKFYAGLAVHRPSIFVGPALSEVAKVIQDFGAGTVVPQGRAEDLAARIRHYRLNAMEWFTACEGARKASEVFTDANSIQAFITRAKRALPHDLQNALNAGQDARPVKRKNKTLDDQYTKQQKAHLKNIEQEYSKSNVLKEAEQLESPSMKNVA